MESRSKIISISLRHPTSRILKTFLYLAVIMHSDRIVCWSYTGLKNFNYFNKCQHIACKLLKIVTTESSQSHTLSRESRAHVVSEVVCHHYMTSQKLTPSLCCLPRFGDRTIYNVRLQTHVSSIIKKITICKMHLTFVLLFYRASFRQTTATTSLEDVHRSTDRRRRVAQTQD